MGALSILIDLFLPNCAQIRELLFAHPKSYLHTAMDINNALCRCRGFGAFKSSNENKSLPHVHSCIFNTAWTCLSRYFDPASRVIIVTLFITLVNGSEFGKSGHVDGGLSDVTA